MLTSQLEKFGQDNIVWFKGKGVEASSRSGKHVCMKEQLAKYMLEVLCMIVIYIKVPRWQRYIMRKFDKSPKVD